MCRFAAREQNLCLDDLQQDNEKPYNLGLYTCHRPNVTRSQFFTLTNTGVLRNELSCASVQQRYDLPFNHSFQNDLIHEYVRFIKITNTLTNWYSFFFLFCLKQLFTEEQCSDGELFRY